jgi:hypothetical protein
MRSEALCDVARPARNWPTFTPPRWPVFAPPLTRCLIHVAGFNLGLLMRAMQGCRNAEGGYRRKERAHVRYQSGDVLLIAIFAVIHREIAAIIWRIAPEGS